MQNKILKIWKRYSKIYIQIGPKAGDSTNFILEGKNLVKPWMHEENPNRYVDINIFGVTIHDLEKAMEVMQNDNQ